MTSCECLRTVSAFDAVFWPSFIGVMAFALIVLSVAAGPLLTKGD